MVPSLRQMTSHLGQISEKHTQNKLHTKTNWFFFSKITWIIFVFLKSLLTGIKHKISSFFDIKSHLDFSLSKVDSTGRAVKNKNGLSGNLKGRFQLELMPFRFDFWMHQIACFEPLVSNKIQERTYLGYLDKNLHTDFKINLSELVPC